MILSDFHTHSSNSGDSDTKMELLVKAALDKGLKHLCITEHLDLEYPEAIPGYEDEVCDFNLDANAYMAEYKAIYEKYCNSISNSIDIFSENIDENNFNLFFGVEVGLQPQVALKNNSFVNKYPFDFVIASSHVLDSADPYYPIYWEGKDEKAVFRHYFESIYENICLYDNFDVYGHLDYIVRYGKEKDKYYNYSEYADVIDSILKKLIGMGKGIEINTGGLKNGLKFPNPCPDILKRYRELGGEIITIGSDAHTPEYIGYKFDIVSDILVDCGFSYYTIFKDRKPRFMQL